MDRMFDDFTRGWAVPATFGTSGMLSPKVNVAETDKGLEVTADLPGIDQKDIEINLANGILTLKAEHKAEKEEKDEKKHYHLVERSFGTFMAALNCHSKRTPTRSRPASKKECSKSQCRVPPLRRSRSRRLLLKAADTGEGRRWSSAKSLRHSKARIHFRQGVSSVAALNKR
jgi:hypothetical protein